jgi:transcriptional regulator with XRE-family HTH domain
MLSGERVGIELASWRREAGLTQTELAKRMQTKQSVISRAETGRTLPSLPFIERVARACGRAEIVFRLDETPATPEERRRRVRRALGDFVFNPWDRDPSPEEARTLIADGLTRERFESRRTARSR